VENQGDSSSCNNLTHQALASDADNTVWLTLSLRVCVLSGLQSTFDSKSRSSSTGVDDDVNMVAAATADEDLYRVLVLGGPGVGKTAITQQFLTSEYMAAQNTSFGQLQELYSHYDLAVSCHVKV